MMRLTSFLATNPPKSRENPRHPRLRPRVYPCFLSTPRLEELKSNQNALCIVKPDVTERASDCPCDERALHSRFMTMDTDARASLEMSLLVASQVSSAPSSDLERSETTTVDVTVLPEETSDEEGRSLPLRSHQTDGRGRPEKKNLQKKPMIPTNLEIVTTVKATVISGKRAK